MLGNATFFSEEEMGAEASTSRSLAKTGVLARAKYAVAVRVKKKLIGFFKITLRRNKNYEVERFFYSQEIRENHYNTLSLMALSKEILLQ